MLPVSTLMVFRCKESKVKNINMILVGLILSVQSYAAELSIEVTDIEKLKGNIHIGLFIESGDFPKSAGQWQGKIISADQVTITATFTDIPAGDYAIAVFQDLNNNQALDTNFFGIPKEPYGFSGGNRTMGAPDFSEAKFSLDEHDKHPIKVGLK